jgi:hypothetical protein
MPRAGLRGVAVVADGAAVVVAGMADDVVGATVVPVGVAGGRVVAGAAVVGGATVVVVTTGTAVAAGTVVVAGAAVVVGATVVGVVVVVVGADGLTTTAPDAVPVPPAFTPATVNVYDAPFVRPTAV